MHYAIGDIHSNIQELSGLLEQLRIQSGDTLIFLGDYIDCLPQTKETLTLLASLAAEHECIFLKGNHEFLWEKYLLDNEKERRNYLLEYGAQEALSEYAPKVQEALIKDEPEVLKEALHDYLDLIAHAKDWHMTDQYLFLHAGLLPEQYDQKPLIFVEKNYFIRLRDIPIEKRYLGTHTLIAAHSPQMEPIFAEGYINIDLGARLNEHIGAFCVEENVVIRSDGKRFARA